MDGLFTYTFFHMVNVSNLYTVHGSYEIITHHDTIPLILSYTQDPWDWYIYPQFTIQIRDVLVDNGRLGGGFKYFDPHLGKIPNLTNIFQMG